MRARTKLTILVVLALLVLSVVASIQPVTACGCVRTPGYWKNHPEEWPVDSITIGEDTYTKEEAIAWMMTPVRGDKTITMFAAYVAAKLNNELMGQYPRCIRCWMVDAREWLDQFEIGDGVRANSEAWQYSHGELIYWMLDAYNNGDKCVPACE